MKILISIISFHCLIAGSIAFAQEPPTPPTSEPPTAAPQTPAPSDKKPEEAQKALERPEEARPVQTTDIERGGVLLKKRELQLEILETYAHFSTNQLFISGFSILPILVIGPISIERIRRDTFVTSVVARYGVMENMQVELRVPYHYTVTQIATPAGTTTGTVQPSEEKFGQTAGLGDIEGTLTTQVARERGERPAVLLSLGFKGRTGRDLFEVDDPALKPPTGTGFNSVRGSVTMIKTTDPAVIFGTLSYAYAIPREDVVVDPPDADPTLVDFDPGDNISFGIGLAFAINYRLSISFQYQQSITLPTLLDGDKVPNSVANAASLRIGSVWRVSEKTSIDFAISPGLTPDAPDFRVELRLPYRF